ncbi:hypothetical protein [Kerstersia gyiorum]|uniref:Uncharacterized protein n=2 Tax=Kerstersia gyiorum TaxID=206506 RepID=A0A171KWQ1_9BURK|nr:hypothetical protein [Kerstersia gyiorum]KKO73318.1 hypothetical protein AAV32_03430 [Kerstersia gyiorum]
MIYRDNAMSAVTSDQSTTDATHAAATVAHACQHAPARREAQGLASRAWLDASAAARLWLVGGVAVAGALLVIWATLP